MNRIYLTILSGALILGSCKSTQKTLIQEIDKPLSESKQREYQYALTEATKQKIFGNYNQAVSLYQKCIEVNPGSDVAYFQMAGIYMMAREIERAKQMNLKAVQINPENFWYRIQLGQIYLISQDLDSATIVYEEIVDKWKEKIEVKYELAGIYAENDSPDKALRILNEIEKENGISEPVSLLKEQIYMRKGKTEMAEKVILDLLEISPENIRYLGILAELYSSAGENEKAVETYRKIFEIEPENGRAQLSMAEFYRMNRDPVKQFIYLEKAFANPELELQQKVMVLIEMLAQEEFFEKHKTEIYLLVKQLENQHPEDYRMKTVKADYLLKAGKQEEALKIYNEVLEEHKGNYYIWEQAVFIENMMGRNEEVYYRCKEAMKYFNDRPLLYLLQGSAALQMGREKESIQILEKGLEYVKNNVPVTVQFYSFLAEAWRNEKDLSKSDQYFEKAIAMDPDNFMILNNYSYYLALRGIKLKEAESMSKKTIEAEPNNPTYLDTYAWILYKSGQYVRAKTYLEKALENGGDQDADILEHYGDVLKTMDQQEQAEEYWKKALEAGGDKENLEKKIGY